DDLVTGVQTCALPIWSDASSADASVRPSPAIDQHGTDWRAAFSCCHTSGQARRKTDETEFLMRVFVTTILTIAAAATASTSWARSEERRVGKEESTAK